MTKIQKSLLQKGNKKSCQKCRITKPITEFSVNKKGVLKVVCDKCVEELRELSKWNNR